MRKLLNTLYVTSPDTYLALDGENVVVRKESTEAIRLPLHNLEGIVAFGYTGASPALMGACAKRNISLCFMTQHGRFLARVVGEVHGNVTLRKTQYLISESDTDSTAIARNIIVGKLFNARWVIERATRDYALRLDIEKLKQASKSLQNSINRVQTAGNLDQLRGFEGEAASVYFGVLNDLILQQKEDFTFVGRNRRPPMDNVNALLSFAYTLLASETTAALETVGLDPYVGFLHRATWGRGLKSARGNGHPLCLLASPPTRGRGLKYYNGAGYHWDFWVAPYTGAWIEIPCSPVQAGSGESPPARGRGLKYFHSLAYRKWTPCL